MHQAARQAPLAAAGMVSGGAPKSRTQHDCPGTGSLSPHGFCRGAAEAARVHHRRAPAARDARQPLRGGSAEGLRRGPRRTARSPDRLHQRAHAAACGALRRRHAADTGLPARDPARDPARPVVRQEGSHRRQCARRRLRREGIARRLFPEPAGRDAARRRELHRARHHEEPATEAGQGVRIEGRRRGRKRVAGRARRLHRESERHGPEREDRSADRPRARARARDPGPVPPAQEQSAARRRGRRRQDGDCRGARAPHRRRRGSRAAEGIPGLFARHGRAARRHEVPRRLRAAAQGRAETIDGEPEVDPVHRRDPHDHRRGCGFGRHARRLQPAEARLVDGRAEVHRRHDLRRVSPDLREGPRAFAALPEGGCSRAVDRRNGRDPQGPEDALRGAPRRQVRAGGAHVGGGAGCALHQRPPLAGQGDRRHRRGRRGAEDPAQVAAEESHREERSRGNRR